MKKILSVLLVLAVLAGTLVAGGSGESNAAYPNKIIQMIVPFGAGGGYSARG